MEQIEQLISVLRATPSLMRVLDTARALHLPDPLVFSGAVYQPVLNHLTGRASDYGIRITIRLISTMRTSPMRPKTRSSREWQQISMSRFATWSRSAIRRACTFGSSANLASHIHLFPRPLRHSNASPRPSLRSAYVSNPTAACTLRRLLASAICSRYACGLIHGAKITGFARIVADVVRRWPELIVDCGRNG